MDKTVRNRPVGRKSASSIAVIVALSIYAFAQPHLNERFGWNLPGLSKTHQDKAAEQERRADPSPLDQTGPESSVVAEVTTTENGADSKPSSSIPGLVENKTAPTADPKSDDGDELLYGLLREVRTDRYISPQGLQYLPGSAEGHRLEHLRRHTQDQPSRPGKHGVFDGGMEGALTTIDDAYQRAKKNQRTTKQVDRDRTIYTVDMGRRIGYVGGRDGNRQRKPMARRVKMVLEGTQVITAYPL